MKLLGKRSVASVLKVTLDGLFYLTMVVWALMIFLALIIALIGNAAPHDEFVNLHIPYNLEQIGQKEAIFIFFR